TVRGSHLSHTRAADLDGGDEPDLRTGGRGAARRCAVARAEACMTQRLPGDTSSATEIARIIRVDHAGEYGAARIYAGQLAVLGRGGKADQLRDMRDQEQAHLDTFNAMIADRRVRPTALLPFWHLAGFALGFAT